MLGRDEVPLPPAQQVLSSPTGTEHSDAADGSTRGCKAASNAARATERREQGSSLAKIMSGIAELRLRTGGSHFICHYFRPIFAYK